MGFIHFYCLLYVKLTLTCINSIAHTNVCMISICLAAPENLAATGSSAQHTTVKVDNILKN